MKYDVRCTECSREWEVERHHSEPNPECGACGSADVKTIWKATPTTRLDKDPYDALHGGIPDSKRIFSGPKVHSK